VNQLGGRGDHGIMEDYSFVNGINTKPKDVVTEGTYTYYTNEAEGKLLLYKII